MKPVVLVQRTLAADAFRYTRFEDGKSTHVVETSPVSPKEPVMTLSAAHVEEMRADPKRFFGEKA